MDMTAEIGTMPRLCFAEPGPGSNTNNLLRCLSGNRENTARDSFNINGKTY